MTVSLFGVESSKRKTAIHKYIYVTQGEFRLDHQFPVQERPAEAVMVAILLEEYLWVLSVQESASLALFPSEVPPKYLIVPNTSNPLGSSYPILRDASRIEPLKA